MAINRKAVGSRTVERLTEREDRYSTADLREESVAGGGKVIRGNLATRALEVLGARAMTLDRSVVVADDFNMQNIEDQALFAHEQYHAMHGDGDGGGGGSNYRDAEEIAARAVESLVLSRSAIRRATQPVAGPPPGTSRPKTKRTIRPRRPTAATTPSVQTG